MSENEWEVWMGPCCMCLQATLGGLGGVGEDEGLWITRSSSGTLEVAGVQEAKGRCEVSVPGLATILWSEFTVPSIWCASESFCDRSHGNEALSPRVQRSVPAGKRTLEVKWPEKEAAIVEKKMLDLLDKFFGPTGPWRADDREEARPAGGEHQLPMLAVPPPLLPSEMKMAGKKQWTVRSVQRALQERC